MKNKIILYFGFLLILFLVTNNAEAAQFYQENNYSLPAGQTINETLYISGSNVDVGGDVNSDLFVIGGTVVNSGKVTRDVFAAGGNVAISGDVGFDVHAAGASVTIDGTVNGETMAMGGEVMFMPTARLNKSVYVSGGTVVINGTNQGDVNANGNRVELHGTINGNVNIQTSYLAVDPNLVINGNLSYTAPSRANIPASAKIKSVQYNPNTGNQRTGNLGAVLSLFWLYKLITGIIVALLLYFFFRKGTAMLTLGTLTHFWTKLLLGLIILIVLPVIMVLVAVTLIGIPFSVMALLIYILFMILAKIGSGIVFGTWLFSLFERGKGYRIDWLTVLVGVVVLTLISLIPLIGWLASFIFFLAFFGELFIRLYGGLKLVWSNY